ncbi:MAG: methyltransferase domain-containing protein [Actinomycetota bacterium]|nr:methyltransferase domain-containing protein [Actinomycetota bacterium]
MAELTRDNLRHFRQLFRQGSNPAAVVYDSLGADFVLAPAPGWLNLGLWEGPGHPDDAPAAVRRLVEVLCAPLPRGAAILDVGNGLGAQDLVIAEVARPQTLVALNITESQLHAGRPVLAEAGGLPVVGDATRLPLADESVDGVISVEAAFHFPSRAAFFSEARRVLRPGGVLSMSDVSAERPPRRPSELLAGFGMMRFWGLGRQAIAGWRQIAAQARQAGLVDVEVERVGDRVFDQALSLARHKLEASQEVPAVVRMAGRTLLAQWGLLWERGMIEYLLLHGRVPG